MRGEHGVFSLWNKGDGTLQTKIELELRDGDGAKVLERCTLNRETFDYTRMK